MKRMKNRVLACLCTLALAVSLLPAAAAAGSLTGAARSDRGIPLFVDPDGNYCLVSTDGYLFHYQDGHEEDNRKLMVRTYSRSFQEISSRELPIELHDYAGFFAGENYNFLVFAQDNLQESDSVEVIRVVKYSKDWTRLGAASLYGANTIGTVGQHGNFSYAEYGGMLYIHLGHATYKLTDGLNHQTNMTFCVRQSDMVVTDQRVGVTNTSTGFVAHAMAQDILVDSAGNIITLDTGDGHPRGASLFRYSKKAGSDTFTGSGSNVVFATWPGTFGDVQTGARTTSLVETAKGYLSAYIDSGRGSNYTNTDSVSAYLAFTPKDNFSQSATRVQLLAAGNNQESVGYVYLVPTSSQGGYVLWYTRMVLDSGTYHGDYKLYYSTYSVDGTIGAVHALGTVPMPYNGPIYTNGKVVWCGAKDDPEGLKFCTLDETGLNIYAVNDPSNQQPNTPDPTPTPTPGSTPSQQPGTGLDAMLAAPTFSDSAALKTDGTLWAWGNDAYYGLGISNRTDSWGRSYQSTPAQAGQGYIAAGSNWGVKSDHSLWMWGWNGNITGDITDQSFTTTPIKVMDNVAYVSGDEYEGNLILVLKTDGSLWGWGTRRYLTGENDSSLVPASSPIQLLDHVKQVDCSGWGWMALKEDGTLWSGGVSNWANLNASAYNRSNGLTPISQLMDGVAAFSLSYSNTLVIKTDGSLWSWGDNVHCQVGNGGVYDGGEGAYYWNSQPVKILDDVVYASAGYTAFAITSDGTLYGWGNNQYGQLGFTGGNSSTLGAVYNGSSPCQSTPVRIADGVVAVTKGTGYTSFYLKADGSLWAAGDNYNGAAGISTDLVPKSTSTFTKILDGVKLPGGTQATQPTTPTAPTNPSTTPDNTGVTPSPHGGTAYASSSTITVDGKRVNFQAYALKDAQGNETNYMKLRDVAYILNGTDAQFQVGWDGSVVITTGRAYTANGSEMSTPFSGNRAYTDASAATRINGSSVRLSAILLKDASGGGYTYYKLRDLGQALGFNVGWSAARGIYIETDRPYQE